MQSTPPPASDWQPSSYSNLVRYVPSGVYFARVRIKGKLLRKSLKTRTLTVAKLRLDDLQKAERGRTLQEGQLESGKMTFGEAADLVKQGIKSDAALKPRTKAYYDERLSQLYRTWSGLKNRLLRSITQTECEAWSTSFRAENSSTSYNHTVTLIRRVFKRGIEHGACYLNLGERLKYAKIHLKKLRLPETEQFKQLVEHVEKARNGFDAPSADLVRFLAYGGFRITEARNVTWGDCDFDRDRIHVRGHAETGTKNSDERYVPMIPEMQKLLERLRLTRASEPASTPVMTRHDCRKALAAACETLGIHKITHHDLRHLFATRCIESQIDIPTVSRWLGHKDGGALAMKVYGHLRDEHSQAMAQKVSFG